VRYEPDACKESDLDLDAIASAFSSFSLFHRSFESSRGSPVDRHDVALVPDDQDRGIVALRWTNVAWQLGRSFEDRSDGQRRP